MTKVVGAFTDSLVQFVSDSTRDITDFIRLGRSFWPVYIEPLGPHNIEKTLESVRKKMSTSNRVDGDLGQEIMAHLGQKFFNHIGTMSGDVTRLFLDSPVIVSAEFNVSLPKRGKRECKNNLPYLRSCLLLAAFICQNNRPDQDRKVFSIQGNGKRTNRTREKMQSSDNAAFASSSGELQQLKSLRPRPFPVERAFSIFATLVNLNPGKFCGSSLESLGSTRLYEDLAQLVDLGYLHPASFTGLVKGEQVNLNNSKYWCSLAKDEAANIAKQIQIPLHNYIV